MTDRRTPLLAALLLLSVAGLAAAMVSSGTPGRMLQVYRAKNYPHRTDIPHERAAHKVLWVGNSHSWRFGLVGRVQTLAETSGTGPMYVRWANRQTLPEVLQELPSLLEELEFDTVVLQPQSTAANRNHPELFERVAAAVKVIRDQRPEQRIVLYENWRYTRERRASSHRQIEIDALFCSLGKMLEVEVAWVGREFDDEHVSADGNHVSEAGAVLASQVLHQVLTGPPAELPTSCVRKLLGREYGGVPGVSVTSVWNELEYRRPNRYRVFTPKGGFLVDGEMPLATASTIDREWGEEEARVPWVQLSERLPGTHTSVELQSGPVVIGSLNVTAHRESTPLSVAEESWMLELDNDVWFVGDVLSAPCPSMATSWEVAEASATWLRSFGEAHPDATVFGTAGAQLRPGDLGRVADELEAYVAVWKSGDEELMAEMKEGFRKHEMCNRHWAFQGVSGTGSNR